MYIESLPPSKVSELTLDERIFVEEIWRNLQKGDIKKAYNQLSKMSPGSPFYHAGIGYAYFIGGDLASAEQSFKTSTENFPDMLIGHLGLAQIYLQTGREDPAFNSLREVLKIDPYHPWAKPRYDDLKTRMTEQAISQGKALLVQGDTEGSRTAYLKALHYSPESMESHLALAQIYRNEGKLENALIHLNPAYSKEPDNPQVLNLYGEILFQQKNYKESLNVYERLTEIEPDNREARQKLETIKNRLGIFELPSQYDAIQTTDAVTREDIAALIGVKFKQFLEESSNRPQILVDISTSWASKFILMVTSAGLLDVFPNHTFQPKKVLSRAEMAEILSRLISHLERKGFRFIQTIPPEKIEISDVPQDNYYHEPIIRMISYDIMGFYPDRTFRPDLSLSGQESLSLLDLILALVG